MRRLRPLDFRTEDLTLETVLTRQARRHGDKPYLLFEDRRFSYAEVEDVTRRLAEGMLRCGLHKGQHVAVLAANSPESLFMHFALGRMGAIACAVNTAAKGEMLTYFLDFADCTALVCDSAHLSRFQEVAQSVPRLQQLVVIPDADAAAMPPPGDRPALYYDELLRPGASVVRPTVQPADVHGIFFTSGTTGPSKGIVATSAQILAFAAGRVEFLDMREDDVVYTCLPLFHGNALHTAAFSALLTGATLALGRRFSASGFWSEARRHKATYVNLLSSMTDILWAQPPSPQDRQHSIRQCTMVPVPAFARAFEERFNTRIVSSYALSDFGQGTFLQPGFPAEKFRSAGQVRPGVEMRVVDDDDRVLPPGEPGEICLRSAVPELGRRSYYKHEQLTDVLNRDGWFHTGDRGYLDEDGYLFFVDRKKDAIRRRGENISSWEVEQAIAAHPSIAEVAVIPVASGMSEDEVAAFLVVAAGHAPDPAEIIRFCERNLAYFMVPRFIAYVDSLPKTPTQKVQKQQLQEMARLNPAIFWDREQAGVVLTR
ncbi:MAG: AMP-binding protein [Burkholderiaceae bacterium]|nr:AMP-binding protein [Burkholderiaceae bacterium]